MPKVFETILLPLGDFNFGAFPSPTTTYRPWGKMADTDQAVDVMFRITSSLDEAVDIQLVGHVRDEGDEENGLVNISSVSPIGVGNTTVQVITINVRMSDARHPFLGLAVVTGGSAPNAGSITAEAYIRNALATVN